MGWPPKFNQSFRRVRIGFCFERGDWWVEVRCDIERLSLALRLAVSCPKLRQVRGIRSGNYIRYARLISTPVSPLVTKTTPQSFAKFRVWSHLICSEAGPSFIVFV